MTFDPDCALAVARQVCTPEESERGLDKAFVEVCRLLNEDPESLSWRGAGRPGTSSREDLLRLAGKYFDGYRSSDFPAQPSTVPDEMVGVVMRTAYGYTTRECERIKAEHQRSMCAENCVGALLERYLDSVLHSHGWYWCCGSLVKAIDFIKRNEDGSWILIQVKNRDNSENSSSSAIRNGTPIEKWFRTYSRSGRTNWENLPQDMVGFGLGEAGFVEFASNYLVAEARKRAESASLELEL